MLRNELVQIFNISILSADLFIKFFDSFWIIGFVIVVDEVCVAAFIIINVACLFINAIATLEIEFAAFRIGVIEVKTCVAIFAISAFTTLWTVRKFGSGCLVLGCFCVMIGEIAHVLSGLVMKFYINQVHCCRKKS